MNRKRLLAGTMLCLFFTTTPLFAQNLQILNSLGLLKNASEHSNTPEPTLLDSSGRGATVKEGKPGAAKVAIKFLGAEETISRRAAGFPMGKPTADPATTPDGIIESSTRGDASISEGRVIVAVADKENEQEWGESGPALQRLSYTQRQMAALLRQANQALNQGEPPNTAAKNFYAELAKLNLKAPMVELNRLKSRLTEVGLETAALGEKLGGGGTPVERALLVYRREITLDSIRAAVAEVARSHGADATGSVFLAKIGKWAIQNPDMFTLAGDIDFSFMGARPEIILALRDAYVRIIQERTGLSMVDIDSVATAHGFAEHLVYMGIQGRKFADDAMMGMNEGVEQIDFRNPDTVGTKAARQITGAQALNETVLEEVGIRYREEGHEAKSRSQAAETERTWKDRRNQTVEPMLSMEMARHLEADIIRNVDVFAAIDIIKKGAKYLRRSNDQTTADLGIPAADPGWAKFVVDVDEKAKTAKAEELVKFIDAEMKRLNIPGFEMKVVDGKAILVALPGGAEQFLATAKGMIWNNVSNGLEARIRGLTDALNNRGRAAGPGTPDDLRPERLADTIRMLAAGLEVMKHDRSHIPADVLTKVSVLVKLIESYSGQRTYSLPREELEKIRDILREAAGNENTLLLKMGAVVDHIDKWMVKHYDTLSAKLPAGRQLAIADAKIDALNSALDFMDNTILGALRDRGVIELDLGVGADGTPRLYAATFPRIASINQRLNQSILGRIGNNTAFKTFNLAQEGEAYYAALMQANTPGEAFSNIATEIFRRRVPGGGAVEAIIMENYLRASVEVVYTIFPPLAIPEGLYGIGASLYESGKQSWWKSELEFLIDSLYDHAQFEAVDGHPGAYRLKQVTYKRPYSRKDLETGKDFILDPNVDQTLTKNLRESDPFLTLMEELQNHGAAGDKVRAHFRSKADKRWEELKSEYVQHMIEKLEKRYAAEIADLAGKIPEFYAELIDAIEKLEIKDRVLASMDVMWESYSVKFKDYWVWLKNTARQGIWGGTLAETERNRAAREVMRYRDAYKSVLAERGKLESAIVAVTKEAGIEGSQYGNIQHRQRLLTGITFLTGKPDEDMAVARQWSALAAKVRQAAENELLAIKNIYLPRARLDNDFDKKTLGGVFFEDIWIQALRFMKVPVISAGSVGRAIEQREGNRAALVHAFRIRYANQSGTASVWVLRLDDGKPTKMGITNAKVVLKGSRGDLVMVHKGGGLYVASGLSAGPYRVTVAAEGFKARDGGKEAKADLDLPPPSETKRLGEATVFMLYATASGELGVSIDVSPPDGRIASSGGNSTARLRANVVARQDSGKLRFQWAIGDTVLDQGEGRDRVTFSGEKRGGQEVTVSVIVIDEKAREGTAKTVIKVLPGEDVQVILASHRSEIGRNEDETIEVAAPVGPDVKYLWTITEGGGYPRNWDGDRKLLINGSYYAGKTLTLGVRATTKDGRTGSAITSLKVKDEDVKKKDKDEAKEDAVKKPRPPRGAGGGASGMFPGEPFNGMQISYSVSGCSLPEMKDSPGFGTYRRYSGRLGGGSLTVSGTARMGSGYGADLTVSVSAGPKAEKFTAYIKSGWPGFNTQNFNLTVPIPDDATSGAFSINMDGRYSMGGGWRGLGVSGSCTADGPEGEAPKGTEDLKVELTGPKDPVPVGEKVEISAKTRGGRFPYEYTWSGGVEGQSEKVSLTPRKPGDYTVSVTVSDTDGKTAMGELKMTVAPVKFELDGMPQNPVYGSQAKLKTRIVGPSPKGVKYRYLWQANEPGIEFQPVESTNGEATVTFGRMGPVKVWSRAVEDQDGSTAGETDQKEANVAPPKFTITFTPPDKQGRMGQEIRAKIVAQPEVPTKLIDYRWFEPASSNRMEYADNAAEIGFKVKDAKPLALRALARVPHYGDEIANITSSYTGISYDVKIGEPRAAGPRLQIWQCDTQLGGAVSCGMKDIPSGQFATFQDITLRAVVTPAPESPRYHWSVDPTGSCGLPGIANELKLNCSSTGSYTVKLEILSADGILLGQAERSISISVRDEQIKQAPRSQQAHEKMQQARQLVAQGKLDEGISLAEEAGKLDPKNTEAPGLLNKWKNEKRTVLAQIEKVRNLISQNRFGEGERELAVARNLHARYLPVMETEKLLKDKKDQYVKEIAAKLNKAKELVQQGKLDEASSAAEEVLKADPRNQEAANLLNQIKGQKQKMEAARQLAKEGDAFDQQGRPGEALRKYQEAQRIYADKNVAEKIKQLESRQAQAKRLRGEGESFQNQKRVQEAIAKYRESLKHWPDRALEDYIRGLEVQVAKTGENKALAEKLWNEGKDLFNQNKPSEALSTFKESLKYWPDGEKQNYVNQLETNISQKKAQAQKLLNEGAALQQQGKLTEAVKKYKESIALWPIPETERHISLVEAEARKQQEMAGKKATADRLWQEGTGYYNQKRLDEGLTKFEESLTYWSDPARADYVRKVEAERATAQKLKDEGTALQNQGKLQEAASRYKESLRHWPDPALETHITKILTEIKNQEQGGIQPPLQGGVDGIWEVSFNNYRGKLELNRAGNAWTGRIWLDAHQRWEQLTNISFYSTTGRLEFTRPISGATQRYSGALSAERLEGTFTQENSSTKYHWWAKRTQGTTTTQGTTATSPYYHVDLAPYGGKKGTPRKVKEIEVEDSSWIRLKATHEKRLTLEINLPQPVRATAVAVVSNLDNAHYLKDDVVTTVLTVHTTSGDRRFEFKAGIHSSEWNRSETGGADHRWPRETYIGDKRWMAAFNLPQGTVVTGLRFDHRDTDQKFYHGGAAPGFCLRGITLVGSGSVAGSFSAAEAAGTSSAVAATTKKGKVIFENGNIGGVSNAPTRSTTFTINSPHQITLIYNYHWNSGRGARPGTIGLRHQNGTVYGPWQTAGKPGQGGVQNAGWECYPNVTIPAGTYTVVDSDPPTWAQNSGSQGAGFSRVEGYPTQELTQIDSGRPISDPGIKPVRNTITVTLKNGSRENVHLFQKGESFSPNNRVTPGESRKVTITAPSNGWLEFCAGRDQKIISCEKKGIDPGDTSRLYTVLFDESNPYQKVMIQTGLR